jgi:hypothetical protein
LRRGVCFCARARTVRVGGVHVRAGGDEQAGGVGGASKRGAVQRRVAFSVSRAARVSHSVRARSRGGVR